MRKIFAAILALAMIFSLCACSTGDGETKERDCGVYITVEAADIYAVSYGTGSGSESFSNKDKAIKADTLIHFDFSGDAAESKDSAIIDYSICAYDENLDIIAEGSFSDDFSDMAKYNFVITEDHHILYEGQDRSGGGDILVSYEDQSPVEGVSLMSASVSMPVRPDAADAVNAAIAVYNDTFSGEQYEANKAAYGKTDSAGQEETKPVSLEPFSMSRTVRVMRGDSTVLSFRMADRANLGNKTTLAITCHSFDPKAGAELSMSDIALNPEKFTDFCAERVLIATTEEERFLSESMVFVEGYTDNIRALISDGHWYFSAEGLVIAANPGDISTNFYEFVIPYEDLTDVLKEEFLPVERSGSYGNVSLRFASDVDLSELNILGVSPDESISSMLMTVVGNVYDVNIYTGTYNADSGKFTQDRQLVYCSDMMRGAAIAINRAPAEGKPDLMISFTCPDGTAKRLLVSADSANGGLIILDLDGGNEGIPVKGSMSYDLDGNGTEESVKTESGDTLSLIVGKETAATEIKSDADVRLYDLNGDGIMEIYVGGTLESGEAATYCFVYDGVLTALGEPIPGLINEFNGNRVFFLAELDVLGKHTATVAYFYNAAESKLSPVQGFEYIFVGDEVITTAVSLALKDGTSIPAGTELQLKSTDGASYVKVSTAGGVSGVISILKDTLGQWVVNGQPASVCFKELS